MYSPLTCLLMLVQPMLDEFNKAQLVTENKKFRESENSY
jgi:hypothetical protein